MGLIKPFMGGGFPWHEVTTCKKCGRWAEAKSGLCSGHKEGLTTRQIIAKEKKAQKAMDTAYREIRDKIKEQMKEIEEAMKK